MVDGVNGSHGGDEGLNAPVQWAKGLWFAQLWSCGVSMHGGSLRGLYYWLRGQGRAITYEYVLEAAKLAHSLGLVELDVYEGPKAEEDY
jgi:hypothetical protein